jgi:hypothetical protein
MKRKKKRNNEANLCERKLQPSSFEFILVNSISLTPHGFQRFLLQIYLDLDRLNAELAGWKMDYGTFHDYT